MLLRSVPSYPSTPTVDPETDPTAADGRPQADAGECLEGDDDVVSAIRVEVASYETLQQLARRSDDVPEAGTEPERRTKLRVKSLQHVAETVDGADGVGDTTGEETGAPEETGMVSGNAVERESDGDASAEADAEEASTSDGDQFHGRGELDDGDETEADPEQSQY